jgi:hypothetical protein
MTRPDDPDDVVLSDAEAAQLRPLGEVVGDVYDNPEEARLLAHGWPWPLAKATFDPFDYAIGLRGGLIVRFHEASVGETLDWVTLHGEGLEILADRVWAMPETFSCPRGFVVRVSEIVWATDAPEGS